MSAQFGRSLPVVALALLLGLTPQARPEEKPSRNDLYGDPLPPGALVRLGTVRFRHGSSVFFAGFLQDGKQLLTACQDGTFRVWETATGKELRRFGQTQNSRTATTYTAGGVVSARGISILSRVALSADGRTFASGTSVGTIYVWDVATGKELRQFKAAQPSHVAALAFTPDGKTLLAKNQIHTITVWDVATGKELRTFAQRPTNQAYITSAVNSIAVSPDGKTVASGNMEMVENRWVSIVKIWAIDAGKEILKIEGPQVGAPGTLGFSPDGKTLAWTTGDGTVHLNETGTGKELRQVGGQLKGGFVNSMLFTSDGKELATAGFSDQIVRFWEVSTGKELRQVGEQAGAPGGVVVFNNSGMQTLALSSDGKTVATAGNNNTVRIWDVPSGKELNPSGGHQGMVSLLRVAADGKTLLSWGSDNTVRQWDTATGKELRVLRLPQPAQYLTFSDDGRYFVFSSTNLPNAVSLWDVIAGKELHQLTVKDPPGGALGSNYALRLAFSPDGKLVAARGGDQSVRLWETATGKPLPTMTDPSGTVGPPGVVFAGIYGNGSPALAFTPDGATLATVGAVFNGDTNNPYGRTGSVLRLWNVASGRTTRQFGEHQQRNISALTFSPDGRSLATVNSDNTLSLWETATGKERCQLKGTASALAFSASGRILAGSGVDQAVRLWDVATGVELGQFQGHQGSVLNVAFADEDRKVISASSDTTLLIWDRAALVKESNPQPASAEAREATALWSDLGGDDARQAFQALWALVAVPGKAVPVLREHLKPAPPAEDQRIAKLITDLDSNSYSVREKATTELEKLGGLAEPALKRLLAGNPTLEARKRAEEVMERLVTNQTPPAETLRSLRAVEVLEALDTAEAREVLEALAAGAPGARLTQEAKSSLERLGKRPSHRS